MKIKRRTLYAGSIVALIIALIVVVIVAVGQYQQLQKDKLLKLNTAYYYMEEIIEEEQAEDFAHWDEKSARLSILQDYTSGISGMGEYAEISEMIRQVANIQEINDESLELLKQAQDMRVSWTTENWKWSADILTE
jgi:hypothetical protein